jgi:hypothetical protein
VRSRRGQGTVEYAAILLLVSLVLAGGAVAVADASGIGGAVRREMARALCLVGGGDCEHDRDPCATLSRSQTISAGLDVVVLRLGHDHTVIREERSDGSIAVTLLDANLAGLEVGAGVGARLSVGGRGLALGGSVSAAILGRLGTGRTWVLHDRRSADALVHELGAVRTLQRALPGHDPALPTPATAFGEKSLSVSGSGSLGHGPVTASLGISAEDVSGQSVELATGRRTFTVRRRDEATASLAIGAGGVSGSGSRTEEYAVTVDRDGRPIDLAVVQVGAFGGSADLPGRLRPVAGLLGVPTAGGRTYVSETHLDLTDAGNLAAARAFLGQVRAPALHLGRAVDVSRELARRLDLFGVVNARTYASSDSHGGLDAAVQVPGVRGGLKAGQTVSAMRLVAAATRGPDGAWTRRGDCLAAA